MSAPYLLLAADAAEVAMRVGSGRIQGGWGFVAASYAITASSILFYALSLWLRRPRAALEDLKEPPR